MNCEVWMWRIKTHEPMVKRVGSLCLTVVVLFSFAKWNPHFLLNPHSFQMVLVLPPLVSTGMCWFSLCFTAEDKQEVEPGSDLFILFLRLPVWPRLKVSSYSVFPEQWPLSVLGLESCRDIPHDIWSTTQWRVSRKLTVLVATRPACLL